MATRFGWDDFVLDLDAYRLERGGVPLALEPKAFDLLALMVRRPGHLFSKQEIFEAVWPDVAVTDHALTRVVAQVRRVLGDEAREAKYLQTVPTRGYRWVGTSVEIGEPAPAGPPAAPVSDVPQVPDAVAGRRWHPPVWASALLVVAPSSHAGYPGSARLCRRCGCSPC